MTSCMLEQIKLSELVGYAFTLVKALIRSDLPIYPIAARHHLDSALILRYVDPFWS